MRQSACAAPLHRVVLPLQLYLMLQDHKGTPLYVAAMNEATWQHVMAWEALHAGECAKPQLLRFTGRPDELRYGSPS